MASSILKDRRLSFKQGLYSQVIAGMVARTLTAPLDVVKINMQVATFQSSNAGMFGTYANILRDEGTLLAFWKGNFSSCLKIIPHTYIQISTFQHFKHKMADDMGKLTTEKAMKAGAMAGLAATIVTYPLDTIKTRLVCYPFQKSRSPHRGVFSGLYNIVKLEGFRKLYSGLLPTLIANVPYTATMMSMYEWLQSIQHDLRRPPSTVDNFFQGCIASAVALFVTFPLDTVKRRLQARSAVQPYFGPGMCWFIGGTWACIKAAWKDNGIHSFFKGYFPAFIRVVPYHGVMFLTYEACKQFCLIYNGYARPLLSGRSHEAIDQHLDQEELEDVDYFAFEKELGGIDLDDYEEDILDFEEESEEDGQEEAEEANNGARGIFENEYMF